MNAPASLKPVRAIQIDPYKRTISIIELQAKFGDEEDDARIEVQYEGLRAAVFHHREPQDYGYIEHMTLGTLGSGSVHGWIDEEGTLMDWDAQSWLKAPFYPTPLAGNLILTYEDGKGNACDWPANGPTVPQLFEVVEWVDPKGVVLPAPCISEADENMRPIPGTEQYPTGQKTRTYDNGQ